MQKTNIIIKYGQIIYLFSKIRPTLVFFNKLANILDLR